MTVPTPPEPYYADDAVTLYAGDCLDVLRELPDASVDAVVTDPPYLLGFMGRQWDTRAAHEHLDWHGAWCREAFRVLKPGGHLLAFGGTRTWHRLAVAVEDAGFEIRDSIAWLYGSGFPKSMDVSKAIDNAAGAEREITREATRPHVSTEVTLFDQRGSQERERRDNPATAAAAWQGWGTALKPAHEPIVVARKPLAGTVAGNVLTHGTGALNIDACRIETTDTLTGSGTPPLQYGGANSRPFHADAIPRGVNQHEAGRWPANVVLDESQAEALDRQSGTSVSRIGKPRGAASGDGWGMTATGAEYEDAGGASRFFYCAKAPSAERPRGEVAHPTVKPLDLIRWLVRLVTPPGGLVLDPFLGSGTTAEACVIEGFRCVGIEREPDYLPLVVQRLSKPIEPVLDFGAVG